MIKTSETNDLEKVKKELQDSQKTIDKKYSPMTNGWVCPVCGRGNSPFTSTCSCTIGNPFKFPPHVPYKSPYWPNNPFYYRDNPTIVWCDVINLTDGSIVQ